MDRSLYIYRPGKIAENAWQYPLPEKRADGMCIVSTRPPHALYWHEYGNPEGEPIMLLHGGPGVVNNQKIAQLFKPERYRIILFDQRGCGKSIPNIEESPDAALTRNTTPDTIKDIEKLRQSLGIRGKMHVYGGSWGSTLALAYAIKHPDNVKSLTMRGVFLGRKKDGDYYYQGNAEHYHERPLDTSIPGAYAQYPKEWKEYVEAIAVEKRRDMVKAYGEILTRTPISKEEEEFQNKAAMAFIQWEHVGRFFVPEDGHRSPDALIRGAESIKKSGRLTKHYALNGYFLGGEGETNRDNNYLLQNVDKIAHLPIRIVQGEHDNVTAHNQANELVAALRQHGAYDIEYTLVPANHFAYENPTVQVLTEYIDQLPTLTQTDRLPQKGDKPLI